MTADSQRKKVSETYIFIFDSELKYWAVGKLEGGKALKSALAMTYVLSSVIHLKFKTINGNAIDGLDQNDLWSGLAPLFSLK